MLDSQIRDLLVKSQNGDKQAYREFLGWAAPYITHTLRRKIGINDYNEDLTQEVLIGAHKNLNTYNNEYSVKAWLSGIIRYKVADYFRKVGSDKEKLLLTPEEELSEEFVEPEKRYSDKLLVQNFLDNLSGCTKNAVILTKVEGRTIREASEILGVKEVNLRKQLSRAMKQLVKRFEFYE